MEDRFRREGVYMLRDGVAHERGMKNLCTKKVCFVTSDKPFLEKMLYDISMSNDCVLVKYAIESRGGVYIGQCVLTNESSVGDMWARYESHPKAWVTIQDDGFCDTYKANIRHY